MKLTGTVEKEEVKMKAAESLSAQTATTVAKLVAHVEQLRVRCGVLCVYVCECVFLEVSVWVSV